MFDGVISCLDDHSSNVRRYNLAVEINMIKKGGRNQICLGWIGGTHAFTCYSKNRPGNGKFPIIFRGLEGLELTLGLIVKFPEK